MGFIRRAVIARNHHGTPTPETVAAYLPARYHVDRATDASVFISGIDYAGWTLSDYVLPRLASGMIYGQEITHEATDETPDEYIARRQAETRTEHPDDV